MRGSGAGRLRRGQPLSPRQGLFYLFHRIDELLDGTPILIFLDEGWKLLDDELFLSFLTDKMKTIRKLNGVKRVIGSFAAPAAGWRSRPAALTCRRGRFSLRLRPSSRCGWTARQLEPKCKSRQRNRCSPSFVDVALPRRGSRLPYGGALTGWMHSTK